MGEKTITFVHYTNNNISDNKLKVVVKKKSSIAVIGQWSFSIIELIFLYQVE